MISNKAKKIISFLRLIRIHKPIPILLLVLPAFIVMFSEIFNTIKFYGKEEFIKNLKFAPLSLSLKIFIGGLVSRSLGCIINDFFDQKIDSNSERSLKRPFVKNNKYSISPTDPFIITCSIILVLAGLTIMFSLKLGSILICIAAIILMIIYPLTKRFLSVPQIFLGFTYATPVLVMSYETAYMIKISSLILYLGTVFYIFSYDSIYSIQDKEDDLKNQMNSSSVKFGNSLDIVISKSYNLSFSLFLIFGVLQSLSLGFYTSLIFSFIYIKFLIKNLSKKEKKDFQSIFEKNTIPLILIIIGILIDISFLIFF